MKTHALYYSIMLSKFFIHHLIYLPVLAQETDGHGIVKRNAFQLCDLIKSFTGRFCLKYNPYGCFCGYGQEGTEPLDSADK